MPLGHVSPIGYSARVSGRAHAGANPMNNESPIPNPVTPSAGASDSRQPSREPEKASGREEPVHSRTAGPSLNARDPEDQGRGRGFGLLLTGVIAVNAVIWIVPSNIVALIARDRHVLLGRYSREHFVWIIAAAIISTMTLLVGAGRGEANRRRRLKRVLAVSVMALLAAAAVDFALRFIQPPYYDKSTLAYRRPRNTSLVIDPRTGRPVVIHDLPDAARTYPDVPPGFPEFPATLTTDDRGFRNSTSLSEYDIVALGDSFTEGSKVSDEHPWPVRLAAITGRTVCNLGMSGYAPQHYAAALREVGLSLHPKTVVCMLYEENDFREAELRIKPESELDRVFKQSPILQRLDAVIVGALGPINAHAPVRGADILSWLPMRVPASDNAKPYAFAPGLLLDVDQTSEQITGKESWRAIRGLVEDMNETCQKAGAGFVLVYTPSKPHVLLPLATDLPMDKVRAFAMLRAKEKLPPPGAFMQELWSRLDVKETLTRDFCRASAVRFLSLTPSMRAAAAAGQQVYFTYDDHFSPVGHDVAAAAIAEFLDRDAASAPDNGMRAAPIASGRE